MTRDIYSAARQLLDRLSAGRQFRIVPLAPGRNNRVYRVEGEAGPLFLKAYFHHPDDPRDRLGHERAFSCFVWQTGVRSLPRPLGFDEDERIGAFEFVPGRRLETDEVTGDRVAEALAFFRGINAGRECAEAATIPPAADACFSLGDHFALVERRLARFGTVEPSSPLEREALELVTHTLAGSWESIRREAMRTARREGIDPTCSLPKAERCLSPSDFGFHNAILAADGALRFVDFEYAGWDDPTKLACDFLCQVDRPIPRAIWRSFVDGIDETMGAQGAIRRRVGMLLGVHQVKWCCILLNEFLPVGMARRQFSAIDEAEREERQAGQLALVRDRLRRQKEWTENGIR